MLFNRTKNRLVMGKVELASTSFEKLRGLMFRRGERFDYALIFVLARESVINATIHMMFVFFPIDVVYLNKDRKVIDIARNLQPFTLSYSPKSPSKFFAELPAGKAKTIELGDMLEW